MLKGDVFVNQHFPVNTFSAFIDTFLNGECGIKNGYGDSFETTYTEDSVTINSGLACIKGRFFREDSQTTIEFSSVGLVYCRLVIEIDLSKTNTRDELNQLTYKILSDGSSYPELQQEDIILHETGKYQYELASFMCNSSGISGFVDKRTFLDFDSIYESVEEHIREIEQGSIYVTKEEFNNMVTVPIGAVQQFAGTTAPEKYLICDGSAVSRETYSALFDVIGTTYGAGDGSNTFNIPNIQNRIPVGKSNNKALGVTGGSETNTIAKANLPNYTLYSANHSHGVTDPGHNHTYGLGDGGSAAQIVGALTPNNTRNRGATESRKTGISINNATITVNSGGSGTALNNMQPYIVLNYIIRAS